MTKGSRVIGTQRCFLLSSDLCGKHHHGKGRSNEKGSSKQGHDQGLHCRLSRNSVELKKSVTTKVLNSLAELGQAEVKKTGIFTIPGLARIKTRRKPATKASKKMMFGKEVVVKAKPAKTVVKAFAVAALKAVI